MHVLCIMLVKTRGVRYFNVETWIRCAPHLSTFLATRLVTRAVSKRQIANSLYVTAVSIPSKRTKWKASCSYVKFCCWLFPLQLPAEWFQISFARVWQLTSDESWNTLRLCTGRTRVTWQDWFFTRPQGKGKP